MTRIAIIGIGCRFPGGVRDTAGYWSLLAEGRCAISEIPPSRWSLDGFYDPAPDRPDRSYSKWGGFLDDIEEFDPIAFGLNPREAEAMDPQQRLLLQVAAEATEDAMLPVAALRKARTGVFIGASTVDYNLLQRYRSGKGEIQAGTGTALSIVANRISNRLDIGGPSMGIDTACSSSLVAVDTACRHLADGTCDAALAGGVNILLDPRMFVTFSRAHMLSPSGRIRAFDAAADGFVRGEGLGVVLLRRLDDALANGDRIYAVIEATSVNQDGATGTITQPSLDAQIAMLRNVCDRAGIAPSDISYVEAHGTGTPVGDPIEARAIGAVLDRSTHTAPVFLGSAKTNIGHLEPAAGIAGLIKAALILHHGQIPPSLGFDTPNPAIPFADLNLKIPTCVTALPSLDCPPQVLVNSFGFGGTNACALLSARPASRHSPCINSPAPADISTSEPIPIPLSAPSAAHLKRLAASLADAVGDRGSLADRDIREIAAALAHRHDPQEHRAVILAASIEELRERLTCLATGSDWPQPDRRAAPQLIAGTTRSHRKICFTMTGQGGQWWAMGRELLTREPVFRETVLQFDRQFEPVAGWSVMAELTADENHSRIDDAAITPAVMFAFQTGLANVWKKLGVHPDIVLGHSFGEVTAAFLAGGITEASVARLVTHRGLIRNAVDRIGTMAAVGLGAHDIAPMLPTDGSIEIGGYNAPNMVTLTGDEDAIDALIARLQREQPQLLARKLALDFAYHSSWFDPVEEVFKAHVGELDTAPPCLPVVSTVTGALNDRFDADYWWQNLRRPVLYQHAVETALTMSADTFIELGPHRTLSAMTQACAAMKDREIVTVTTLDRQWGDVQSIAVAASQLWVNGVEIAWNSILGTDRRDFALPHRPTIEQQLWHEPEEARRALSPATVHPLLGRPAPGPGHAWTGEISLATHPWLAGHRIDGSVVFPAAAYIEMFATAARQILRTEIVELTNIAFPAALYLASDDEILLATSYNAARRALTIHSRLRDGSGDWQLRAQATAFPADSASASPSSFRYPTSFSTCHIEPETFYSRAEASGYGWHGGFKTLHHLSVAAATAAGSVTLPAGSAPLHGLRLDPRLLDGALQMMLMPATSWDNDVPLEELPRLLPVSVDRIVVGGHFSTEASAEATCMSPPGTQAPCFDIALKAAGQDGTLSIHGLRTAPRAPTAAGSATATAPRLYCETFARRATPASTPSETLGTGPWLWIGPADSEPGGDLATALASKGMRLLQAPAPTLTGEAPQRTARAIDTAIKSASIAGIIYADGLAERHRTLTDIPQAARHLTGNLIAFAQALASCASSPALPPIWILTRGARTTGSEQSSAPSGIAQAAIWSSTRAVALEYPNIRFHLVDLDQDDPANCLDSLHNTLLSGTSETEILLRLDAELVPRLSPASAAELPPAMTTLNRMSAEQSFVLRRQGPAGAASLVWQQAPRPAPGPEEVEVEITAAGLNFRDVMAVNGLLPNDAEPTPALDSLGLEFGGIVRRTGPGTKGIEPGERVFGMARGTLSRFVRIPAIGTYRRPPQLSDADAAALPSAYLTAYMALVRCARMERGETILIHSAAGGVGLAAIAIARHIGARIIATAGTPEKRAYLRNLGLTDVFESRSLAFADDVVRATNGSGVDVVLNSLHGAFLDKSLACLAPYGRFIELGKRDVYADSAIGMRKLAANISVHVLDLARMIEDRPAMVRAMMDEILARLADGSIEPLPARTFEASEVSQAFRAFSDAHHSGKIVVRMQDKTLPVRLNTAAGRTFDPRATYLVTGGSRGFGLAVGRWLAANGAGRVVLASRGGRIDEHLAQCSAAYADKLVTLRLDVRDPRAVDAALKNLTHADKPLKGIVHAAVAYDDGLVPDMTCERIERVLAPKVDGAINLTHAVIENGARLDFFLSFASLAGAVGWPAQTSYAAANGVLAALADWQRANGIRGMAMDWGALSGAGHVARSREMQAYLETAGWIGIDTETALTCLAQVLDCDVPHIMIAAADWQRLAATHRPFATAPRLSALASPAATADTAATLAGLHGAAAFEAAVSIVYAQAAKVLRIAADDLRAADLLADAGIDSLSTFELRNRIEHETGLSLPLDRFAKATRFSELAALLASLAAEAPHRTG